MRRLFRKLCMRLHRRYPLLVLLIVVLMYLGPRRIFLDVDFTSTSKSLITPILRQQRPTQTYSEGKGENYTQRLRQVANSDNVIILALIDQGFIDVAINFWEISIQPFNISNMLFVSLSSKACRVLTSLNIPCHVYEDFSGGAGDSVYMSSVFLRKMNMRTQFILDALSQNFTILNTDTDVLFFKNPLPYFKCNNCNMEILEDGMKGYLNAGFVYLRPSPITAEVYTKMAYIALKNPRSEDQASLNKVVRKLMKGRINYNVLHKDQFVCGRSYYESRRRYFADTAAKCDTCVVVHNNWIVGKPAKIYRQKEMLQWVYDGDKYYSDLNRKYLIYNNTYMTKDNQKNTEESRKALINAFAIGKLLNRTVILPRLPCSHAGKVRDCPWNSKFYISDIDKHFDGKYRESVFLLHPKVPNIIKNSISKTFLIKSSFFTKLEIDTKVIDGINIKVPKDAPNGASEAEIIKWFGDIKESVLKFHSLYYSFKGFSDVDKKSKFDEIAKQAFKKAAYRQHRRRK